MQALTIPVDHSANVAVIRPHGRLDAFQTPALAESLAAQEQANVHHIVVNLSGVDFIDSAALSILVQGLKHALQSGGDLYLCNLGQPVRIIFELTRLDKAFRIVDNEQEAIDAFRIE